MCCQWLPVALPVSFPSPPHSLDTECVCQWAYPVLLAVWPQSHHQLQTWPWCLLCHSRHHQCLCLPKAWCFKTLVPSLSQEQGYVLRVGWAGAPVHLKQLFFTYFRTVQWCPFQSVIHGQRLKRTPFLLHRFSSKLLGMIAPKETQSRIPPWVILLKNKSHFVLWHQNKILANKGPRDICLWRRLVSLNTVSPQDKP